VEWLKVKALSSSPSTTEKEWEESTPRLQCKCSLLRIFPLVPNLRGKWWQGKGEWNRDPMTLCVLTKIKMLINVETYLKFSNEA
jgi:hypothetical protein